MSFYHRYQELDEQLIATSCQYQAPRGASGPGEAWSIAVFPGRSRIVVGTRSGEVSCDCVRDPAGPVNFQS